MAIRQTSPDADHFDLLPFITILMCVLGTLLLVTMSLAAVSLGPGMGEGWLPGAGTSSTKTPILMEWDGEALVVHWPEGKVKAVYQRRAWEGQKTYRFVKSEADGKVRRELLLPEHRTGWDDLLTRMQSLRNTHYALFAVRPSGFSQFGALVQQFRTLEFDIGYEPLDQAKSVRLLPVQKSEEAGR